jgi:hypothetical protein
MNIIPKRERFKKMEDFELRTQDEYVQSHFTGMFRNGTMRAKIRDYIINRIEEVKYNGWGTYIRTELSPKGKQIFYGITTEEIALSVYGNREDFKEKGIHYWKNMVATTISGMQDQGFPIGTTKSLKGYFVPMSKQEIEIIRQAYFQLPKSGRTRKEKMEDIFEQLFEIVKDEHEIKGVSSEQVMFDIEEQIMALKKEKKKKRRSA